MHYSMKDRRIVIIGASAGIGLATAKLLNAAGANLVLASRNEDTLRDAVRDFSGEIATERLDVTVEDDVAAFFDSVGPFDHLVTPAAGAAIGALADTPTAETRALVDSKFWGQYFAVKYGTRQIAHTGSITLFSGTVSQKPMPGTSAYAAVGSAIEAAARIWALEYAPIRINTIVPGVIRTSIWASMLGEDAAASQFEETANALPVNRVGAPEDVAKAAAFLIDNSFVNGTALVIDGGHRLI